MLQGDRHVTFEACFHFRDLGGYETVDGRRVRWGSVFRSDSLHRLPAADLEVALALGLHTVIDLRSTAELERGRFAHTHDLSFHHLPFFEADSLPFKPLESHDPEPPLGSDYIAMATSARGAIAAAFHVLAECDYAVVVHCAAGKGRTGILAALVLASLGVPDESIAADYHLSERASAPTLAWAELNAPEVAAEPTNLPPWALASTDAAHARVPRHPARAARLHRGLPH